MTAGELLWHQLKRPGGSGPKQPTAAAPGGGAGPAKGGYVYCAVGPARLGFFAIKSGMSWSGWVVTDLFGAVPRASVTQFEIGPGSFVGPLTMGFDDGSTLDLEVSWLWRRSARAVKRELGV